MSNYSFVEISYPGEYIGMLTIKRPDKRNALSFAVLEEMESAINELENNSDLRVLIITGTGGSFCSGADLREVRDFSSEQSRRFSLVGHRVFNRIESFKTPVIAAINGHALGGGGELAFSCDILLAIETAKLGQPEAKVGMITGWGATTRLARYVGLAKAKELIFTARLISAEEAKSIGLLNNVFPAEGFMDEVMAVAEQIARNAPIANRLSKEMLNRNGIPASCDESLALAYTVASEDQTEAINAFLEKRDPVFTGK